MGRTFTQIRTFSSDGGLIHDFFRVPTGKSAIVDMIINVNYSYGGGGQINIAIAAKLTKADGSTGSILTDTFAPLTDGALRVLRLERCALESGDTISVSVATNRGVNFGTSVYLGGVLQ